MTPAPFDRNSFAVGISNYRRPRELFHTLHGWMNSTPPGTIIYILHNTKEDYEQIIDLTVQAQDLDRRQHEVRHIVDFTRHPSHWGCLAESWNTLIQHCLYEHEWVVLSQDDVIIKYGWIELLEANPFYYYQGNVGDQVVCFGRELFNIMLGRGWYDQRIRMVGVHDVDFAKRVIRTVGLGGVCIESVTDGFINPIGLYSKWRMAEQYSGGEIFLNRRRAQAVRPQLQADGEGNLIGLDGRDDIVSRDCSQYVLVNRGATDKRPYVDVALEWFKKKWGGWGIGDEPQCNSEGYVKRYVDNPHDPADILPNDYLMNYGVVAVYDPVEDIYYWETAGSPRAWKEGPQIVDDIDWHPYFQFKEINR